ncbi:protein TolR [soil metagenome]
MQSIRRSRRRNMRVNAEISFTNLIDVAFVLLIIFMITAPIMQGGIEVDLPEVQATPLTSAEAVVISVDRTGQLFFEETPVRLDEVGPLVQSHMELRPNDFVSLKIDRAATFEPIAQVLGIMMQLGITNVNLPVTPVVEPRSRGEQGR